MLCCGFESCWCVWVIAAIIVYKILDWLIRVPRIGNLSSRHILVTGCDTGFGHEIAKRLDKLGCHVFAGCLTETGETALRKECSSRLKTLQLDVSKHESVLQAFTFVKGNLPQGQGLWGVMNNAGIGGRKCGPAPWIPLEEYNVIFGVNLLGVIDTTVTFLPLIKKARGRIVSTSSVFGRHSLIGNAAYSISKYGVEAFSDSIRRELVPFGVKVHLIEPGFHKTNISSVETLERSLRAGWECCTPEMKEEYGEEFLNKSLNVVIKDRIQQIASDRISDVVDAYEHALLGSYPRARYVVGKDAKFFWLPIQWLPEWIGDYLLLNLQKDNPIPAACKK